MSEKTPEGGCERYGARADAMTQSERVLRHLETYGSITPMEAMQEYGIMRLGARIYDLKRAGYPIAAGWVEGENRYGEITRFARYTLKKAPLPGVEDPISGIHKKGDRK